jgi:hypothetical protein
MKSKIAEVGRLRKVVLTKLERHLRNPSQQTRRELETAMAEVDDAIDHFVIGNSRGDNGPCANGSNAKA